MKSGLKEFWNFSKILKLTTVVSDPIKILQAWHVHIWCHTQMNWRNFYGICENIAYENICWVLWLEFYKNIPDDFAEMIKEIMKRKGITQENLSFELGVDRKALVNYLNQDRPSVAHVVGICVALKMPYFISMEILGADGIKLRSTEQDFLYRQFLLNAENLTVSRCEDILKQHNEKPLFRGEQR